MSVISIIDAISINIEDSAFCYRLICDAVVENDLYLLSKLLANDAILSSALRKYRTYDIDDWSIEDPLSILQRDLLSIACGYGYLDMVKFMCESGAEPNENEDYHYYYEYKSPIEAAFDGKHLEVVRYLIARGANLFVYPDDVNYLFQVAYMQGWCDIIKHIIDGAGTDFDVVYNCIVHAKFQVSLDYVRSLGYVISNKEDTSIWWRM